MLVLDWGVGTELLPRTGQGIQLWQKQKSLKARSQENKRNSSIPKSGVC